MAFDFQVLGSSVPLTSRIPYTPVNHSSTSKPLSRPSLPSKPKSNPSPSKTYRRPLHPKKILNSPNQFYLQSRQLTLSSHTSTSSSSSRIASLTSSTVTPSSSSPDPPSTLTSERPSNGPCAIATVCIPPTHGSMCSTTEWNMESLDPEVSTDPSWGSSPSSVHVSSPGHSKPTHSLPVDTPPPDHCTRSTKSIGTCIMEEVGKTESHASKKTTNSLPLHSSDPPISGFYDYKHLKAQTVRRNKEYWNIEEVILRRLRYLVDHSCEMPDQLHSLLMTLENSDLPLSMLQQYFPTMTSMYDLRVQLEYYFTHVQPTLPMHPFQKNPPRHREHPTTTLYPPPLDTPLALLKLVERYHPIPDPSCYPIVFREHLHPTHFPSLPLTTIT